MDEQTISDGLDFSASDSTAEQADSTDASSVQETIEQPDNQGDNSNVEATPTDNQVDGQSGVQAEDDAIKEFLANKGINLDEPGDAKDIAYKLGKMALNSEKQFNSKSQEIAQLRRQMEAGQPTNTGQPVDTTKPGQAAIDFIDQQRAAKLQEDVANFIKEKELTPEEDARMIEWMKQRTITDPQTGEERPLALLWLANGVMTLEDIYNASGCPALRAEAVKAKMRGEVQKSMAARQAAKRPTSSATDSSQFSSKPDQDEAFLQGFLGNNE